MVYPKLIIYQVPWLAAVVEFNNMPCSIDSHMCEIIDAHVGHFPHDFFRIRGSQSDYGGSGRTRCLQTIDRVLEDDGIGLSAAQFFHCQQETLRIRL